MPVIGFLSDGSLEPRINLVAAFRQGLSEAGYVDGQNVAIEYRWAQDQLDRLPEMAADLVRHQVAIIVTPGGRAAGRQGCNENNSNCIQRWHRPGQARSR
jgi:putative ABC transport system substrate-binding protein